MIDVHVLTHSGTNKQWLAQCLISLRDEPCRVHIINNDGRSVGEGRYKGYQAGDCDYVAYVDSDDYVKEGVFTHCLKALNKERAVITYEKILQQNGKVFPFPKPMHNVSVYRREDVLPHLDKIKQSHITADHHMRLTLKPTQLDFIGYVWRLHGGGAHNLFEEQLKHEGRLWKTN